jgi:hypothetical protein
MRELLTLFPILFLVYVLQCIVAVPSATTVFLLDSSLRGRLLRNSWLLGSARYRWFLLNPFSTVSSAILVDPLPFSFISDSFGAIRAVEFVHTSSQGSVQFEFDAAPPQECSASLKQIVVGDNNVALLQSEQTAERLAALITNLQSQPSAKRPAFIQRELRKMFSLETIRQRMELFSRATLILGSACFSLLLFLFILAPAAIYRLGLARIWPSLLAILVLFAFFILWAFRRAQRRLFPEKKKFGMQHLLTIAVSPFAAIRAVDALAANLLEEFHPLALACVLLSEEKFRMFAERELRRTRFVTHDVVLERAILDFLSSQKIDSQSLLQPPASTDPRTRTYCPACLTQYVLEEGTCQDCGDVPLEKLSPSKS